MKLIFPASNVQLSSFMIPLFTRFTHFTAATFEGFGISHHNCINTTLNLKDSCRKFHHLLLILWHSTCNTDFNCSVWPLPCNKPLPCDSTCCWILIRAGGESRFYFLSVFPLWHLKQVYINKIIFSSADKMSSSTCHTVLLNTGVHMPMLGFGTHKLASPDVHQAVDAALAAGYRSFDSATVYQNESALGEALKKLLPKYGLTREDVFITR